MPYKRLLRIGAMTLVLGFAYIADGSEAGDEESRDSRHFHFAFGYGFSTSSQDVDGTRATFSSSGSCLALRFEVYRVRETILTAAFRGWVQRDGALKLEGEAPAIEPLADHLELYAFELGATRYLRESRFHLAAAVSAVTVRIQSESESLSSSRIGIGFEASFGGRVGWPNADENDRGLGLEVYVSGHHAGNDLGTPFRGLSTGLRATWSAPGH